MAEMNNKLDNGTLSEIKSLLWGNDLKDEVFSRWTQGFVFGSDERTALVQYEGGPCAVIAPVQGFVVKNALFGDKPCKDHTQLSENESLDLLVQALCDILVLISTNGYSVISLEEEEEPENNKSQSELSTESADCNKIDMDQSEAGQSSCKRSKLHVDQNVFHSRLRCTKCESEASVRKCLRENISAFTGPSGVLLYLYSIVLTKGIEQIRNEVEDPGEPLIHGLFGHGTQSLINLLITGKAVTNVWDNDKDISGL
ncbi:MINY3-like protein, partial [Mya arenaria]